MSFHVVDYEAARFTQFRFQIGFLGGSSCFLTLLVILLPTKQIRPPVAMKVLINENRYIAEVSGKVKQNPRIEHKSLVCLAKKSCDKWLTLFLLV